MTVSFSMITCLDGESIWNRKQITIKGQVAGRVIDGFYCPQWKLGFAVSTEH